MRRRRERIDAGTAKSAASLGKLAELATPFAHAILTYSDTFVRPADDVHDVADIFPRFRIPCAVRCPQPSAPKGFRMMKDGTTHVTNTARASISVKRLPFGPEPADASGVTGSLGRRGYCTKGPALSCFEHRAR
jgi:hypothetical protein